jgi:hypothetical protein
VNECDRKSWDWRFYQQLKKVTAARSETSFQNETEIDAKPDRALNLIIRLRPGVIERREMWRGIFLWGLRLRFFVSLPRVLLLPWFVRPIASVAAKM